MTIRPRGLANLPPARRREIASLGGKAAHVKGTAHKFDSAEAKRAGEKGGRSVSADRAHMAEIGSLGGKAKRPATPNLPALEAQPQTIGEIIKSLRIAAGLSRQELAVRADVTAATIKRVECGNPQHATTLERLRRVTAMKDLERLARDAGLL